MALLPLCATIWRLKRYTLIKNFLIKATIRDGSIIFAIGTQFLNVWLSNGFIVKFFAGWSLSQKYFHPSFESPQTNMWALLTPRQPLIRSLHVLIYLVQSFPSFFMFLR